MTAPNYKKKIIPTYESKTVCATVVIDPSTNKKRLQPDHPTHFQHEVNQYSVGDKIDIKLTNKKRKRTDAQNRYMHLYFSLIGMASGHTTEEIKRWATGKFLTKGIKEVFGEKTRIVKSTKDLKVLEMIEFMMQVEEHTGVPAPDPQPFTLGPTMAEWKQMKAAQRRKYMKYKPNLK